MSTIDFKINLEDSSSNPDPAAPWDYNSISAATTTGVVIANIKDDGNADTGYYLEAITPFDSNTYSTSAADTYADRPQVVMQTFWQTANGGTSVYEIGGFTAGDTVVLKLGGNNGNNRDTQFTVNGVSLDYVDGPASAPTNATEFTVIVPADGIITISITKALTGSFYGYLDSIAATVTTGGVVADPEIELPNPLGSESGVASAGTDVPVSVCVASTMTQVLTTTVTWGVDGIVPAISSDQLTTGVLYNITINDGTNIATYNVTAV